MNPNQLTNPTESILQHKTARVAGFLFLFILIAIILNSFVELNYLYQRIWKKGETRDESFFSFTHV